MKLNVVKTEELIKEIMDRCSDQLEDPEPQFDDVLSFLTVAEIDWFMGELSESMNRRKERHHVEWR
jgi:hypothetical protein